MIRRDYYQVLGITQDASPGDIRAAFVRLSKRHHPDLAGGHGPPPWRLQDVQQAYRCLSDTAKRAEHDQALDVDKRDHFARQRAVQRRLHRYDRRHPRPQPRPDRRKHWWILLIAAVLAAIALQSCAWLLE